MSYAESANFIKWRKTHLWNKDCIPICGAEAKGTPVIVFYCKGDEYPFSVQYRGNGHYFKTLGEAEAYIKGRFGQLFMPIAASDLAIIELEDVRPGDLADRLDECESYVTKDGDWKYDRVPSDLVQDLLAYLRNRE